MRLRFFGYHGTSREAADAIERDGFRPSSPTTDWLGDGIYFWQDAPLRAWEWATIDKGHGPDAAVIGAAVELVTDHCIDLLDIGWHDALYVAHQALIRAYRRTGRPMPVQRGLAHRLDRAVINFLVDDLRQRGVAIRALRGAFQEGEPTFPGSAIHRRSHVQIAVRDPSLVAYLWREGR
jgi:hypothetical protein